MDSSLPSLQFKRKKIRLGSFEVDLFQANIFFAFLSITGQVAEKICLPLWIDSTVHHLATRNLTDPSVHSIENASSTGNLFHPRVDGYFVLSFASLLFVLIFGAGLLFIRVCHPERLGDQENRFSQLQLFLIGMGSALNGVLVVFASSGTRTPTYLQAILGNFTIPMTMSFRFMVLRRVPTRRKFLTAMAVLLSLFICLIPKIFTEINPEARDSGGGQSGAGRILWPLCFMFGLAPEALVAVFSEKVLKMELFRRHVNIVYFLFWTSVYQFLAAISLFWVDFLPEFGFADSIYHFWDNWSFGFKCFFGGAGCSSTSGIRGTMFILAYIINIVGGRNLIRFSEGATLVAIVSALVTPLSFIFWTLFQEVPFQWHPAVNITTWFSIGGLVLMVPAIYYYNTGEQERLVINDPTEKDPILLGISGGFESYSG